MAASAAQRPRRILVVEDDPALRRLLEKLLSPLGDVHASPDGTQALEAVQGGFVPDLVVTDLMMPHMDGYRLTRHLKRLKATQRVPIIMLTAKEGPRDVIDGINAGARHYVTKPFHQDDLLAKVRRALNLK